MIEERHKNYVVNTVKTVISDNIAYAKGEQNYWTEDDEKEIKDMICNEFIDYITNLK